MVNKLNPKKYTVIDLFSGCGGLSLGLHMSKVEGRSFRTVATVDIWGAACDTLQKNLLNYSDSCGADVFRRGLTAEVITELKQKFGVGKIDLVVGGPPCQGFSSSGKRALKDPRNHLARMYLKAIEELKPRVFLMENVVGFTNFQGGKICAEVIEEAKKNGYKVFPAILQASLYGVPQRRRRFIMIGVRSGNFSWPDFIDAKTGKPIRGSLSKVWPGKNDPSELYMQQIPAGFSEVSFKEATLDLPSLKSGQVSRVYRKIRTTNWFLEHATKGAPPELAWHQSSNHEEYLVKMMSELKQGMSAFELPPAKINQGGKKSFRPKTGFLNSYKRIENDKPAPTITRNFTTPSSANCIHPLDDRALTPREGARAQSFPDSYLFAGSSTEVRLQIGNAVPPLLAKALGEAIIRNLVSL
jgi:DNA (cytosine-5)-methyltransferase 1